MRVPKFLLPAPKKLDFGPKNGQIWPKTGIFGQILAFWPIWYIARPKTMQTRCLGDFSVLWVPKLLITPIKMRIFGPKAAKFSPKLAFLAKYWRIGQILAKYLANLVPSPTNANKVPRWFFRYVGTKTFASSVKLRIFGPKTAILPQNIFSWAHIGLAGSKSYG